MAETPAVSVLIPTHQQREALRRALLALCDQTAPAGSYEVVVAVDGSTDGSAEMLAAFEAPYPLRATSGPRRGRAGACNAALTLARGEVAIVLDDDMRPVPELVERHRRHHPSGSRLCVVGAAPVELDGSSPRAARYVKAKFDAHLVRLAEPGHAFGPRDFYSGNASLRTEVLREVGGFDESFAVYGNEDVELSLRLRAAGVEIRFDPEAVARQGYYKDLAGLARNTFEKGSSTVQLARAHPESFAALRLARPRESSRPWLAARAVLLALTRRLPATTGAVFALSSLLENLGLWRRPLFYRAALDYAFWAGADRELEQSDNQGELPMLVEELRRGPIDLLLHG